MSSTLAVFGLGTMGANLARNAMRKGATVVVYNRTREKTEDFLQQHAAEGAVRGAFSPQELCEKLPQPRVLLLMVNAGAAVDDVIDELLPHLASGDILIDGGNSHYPDTVRREKTLAEKGIGFIGMGVSGGEEGALNGPSLMPGGNKNAYDHVAPLLESMAADDGVGGKCVAYMGPGGSGHFVKMVHNGIEYGVMQLIAEAYDMLRTVGGSTVEQLADTFGAWAKHPEMTSFLLEITAALLPVHDGATAQYLIDVIRDSASQKGTGKWTTEAGFAYGVAVPTITAAVDARILSGSATLRAENRSLPRAVDVHDLPPRPQQLRSLVRSALDCSTIVAYAQGFSLLSTASAAEQWNSDLGTIARIWRGGCIIRSALLGTLQALYGTDPAAARGAREQIAARCGGEQQRAWRTTVGIGVAHGVGLPAMAASLAYYDMLGRERLPQNLIAAQRDFFGAHGYQRIDRDGTFHTEWEA